MFIKSERRSDGQTDPKNEGSDSQSFHRTTEGEKIEQITINEIADRANVNRGTIYLHYTDKYDLLDQCIDTYLKQLYESCMPKKGTPLLSSGGPLLQTFEYLEQNAHIYVTLLNRKGTHAFRCQMMEYVMRGAEEQINLYGLPAGMNREITVQFLASAITGLVEWWIVNSMPYPAEELVIQLMMLLKQHLPTVS